MIDLWSSIGSAGKEHVGSRRRQPPTDAWGQFRAPGGLNYPPVQFVLSHRASPIARSASSADSPTVLRARVGNLTPPPRDHSGTFELVAVVVAALAELSSVVHPASPNIPAAAAPAPIAASRRSTTPVRRLWGSPGASAASADREADRGRWKIGDDDGGRLAVVGGENPRAGSSRRRAARAKTAYRRIIVCVCDIRIGRWFLCLQVSSSRGNTQK